MLHRVSLTDISVVVACRNEGKTLALCIESLLRAAGELAQVIVVNDGSTDTTDEILKNYAGRIDVVNSTGLGPGHARNLALRYSTRPYIAFTDGDGAVADDWLKELSAALNQKDLTFSSVGGIQVVSPNAGSTERKIAKYFEIIGFITDYVKGKSIEREVLHNPTCNVLYSRDALEAVSGFDESLWPTEDLDLDLRLKKKGYRQWFTPRAVVEHRRPATIWGFCKMMYRYGFAHAQLVKKYGLCQPLHILPVLFPGLCWLVSWNPIFIVVAWVGVNIFILARSWKNTVTFNLLLPLNLATWLLGFYTGLFGRKRVANANK